MDEAGSTGENLLDAEQPVYALAGVRVAEPEAEAAVRAALGRTQMSELKFSRLRTSGAGRRNVLTFLQDLDLGDRTAAVSVVHKPHMAALKLVDELVEPRMLQRGVQMAWYASGDARRMAYTAVRHRRQASSENASGAMTTFTLDEHEQRADARSPSIESRSARVVSCV
jgi:hypothetical protein